MKTVKTLLALVLFVCLTATAFGGNNQESTKNRAEIKDKFAAVLNDQLGVEMVRFSEEARFREELGADDLDLTELSMAIEDYFDITIPDAEWADVTTIKSALDLIYDIKSERYR